MPHTYLDHRNEVPDGTADMGTPRMITVHWSVTHDETADCNHYNWAIRKDGTWVQMRPMSGMGSKGSHTSLRNSHNIGVGICAMNGEDISAEQIESAARGIAELMGIYAIPIDDVHDHVYWATIDGYGPGSGHPQTKIDLTGTAAGKKAWAAIMKKVPWYRAKIAAGKIDNFLGPRIA